jgi:hypothetical protein
MVKGNITLLVAGPEGMKREMRRERRMYERSRRKLYKFH